VASTIVPSDHRTPNSDASATAGCRLPAAGRSLPLDYVLDMTRTGHCLCGQISYELSGDLIATAVCHCDHCQRQSGGAFSVNLLALDGQMDVTGALSTFEDRGEHGDGVYVLRHFCGGCGSPIYSAMAEPAGLIAVKAGTLDDRSEVTPTVEAWCEHKQPWVDLPGMAVSLDRE
jgi:hypothetical protein